MAAVFPRSDFATAVTVPTTELPVGRWWRLANVTRADPLDWDGRPGETRFVSLAGGYEVLYLARDKLTAFWEVYATALLPLLPNDRKLSESQLRSRRWVEIEVSPGMKVFDATNAHHLRRVGATHASFHGDWDLPANGPGPYAPQVWAETLFSSCPGLVGILYASDKDTPESCAAIFRGSVTDGGAITGEFGPLLWDDKAFLAQLMRTRDFG